MYYRTGLFSVEKRMLGIMDLRELSHTGYKGEPYPDGEDFQTHK
jgi:hypothetical protein